MKKSKPSPAQIAWSQGSFAQAGAVLPTRGPVRCEVCGSANHRRNEHLDLSQFAKLPSGAATGEDTVEFHLFAYLGKVTVPKNPSSTAYKFSLVPGEVAWSVNNPAAGILQVLETLKTSGGYQLARVDSGWVRSDSLRTEADFPLTQHQDAIDLWRVKAAPSVSKAEVDRAAAALAPKAELVA